MWCLCVLSASGVGAIVFLHSFPLADIQCYWYRLRHPHPDKVIWNHCWIRRRVQTNICFLGTWENSPIPPTRVWIIQWIWYVSTPIGLDQNHDHFIANLFFIFSVTSWNVIITFSVISFLLLRASFQTGANDNSSELMGKNENNFAEPCDRDYYGRN